MKLFTLTGNLETGMKDICQVRRTLTMVSDTMITKATSKNLILAINSMANMKDFLFNEMKYDVNTTEYTDKDAIAPYAIFRKGEVTQNKIGLMTAKLNLTIKMMEDLKEGKEHGRVINNYKPGRINLSEEYLDAYMNAQKALVSALKSIKNQTKKQ